MKNKTFKKLSAAKKQNILMRALRSKTNGLLKVNEEAALLSVGARRKQFQIRTFNEINSFVKTLNTTDQLSREVIYGEMEIKKLSVKKALIDSGIAVLASVKSDDVFAVDQLLIYIPETRSCKGQCVLEKNICKHIESYDDNSTCCGLQLVQV